MVTQFYRLTRWTLLSITLLILGCQYKKWETDYFYIHLPSKFDVETDSSSRLIASLENTTCLSPPFLIIEFGDSYDLKQLLKEINLELVEYNKQMQADFSRQFDFFYHSNTSELINKKILNTHIHLFGTKEIMVYIAYMSNEDLKKGLQLIEEVINEIEKQLNKKTQVYK